MAQQPETNQTKTLIGEQGIGFGTFMLTAIGLLVGCMLAIGGGAGEPLSLVIDCCGIGALVGLMVDLVRMFVHGTDLLTRCFRAPKANAPESSSGGYRPRQRVDVGAAPVEEPPVGSRPEPERAYAGRPSSGTASGNPGNLGGDGDRETTSQRQAPRSARAAAMDADDEGGFGDAPTPVPPRQEQHRQAPPPPRSSYGQQRDGGRSGRQQPPPPRGQRYEARQRSNQDKRIRFASCFARAFFFVARADGVTRPAEIAVVDRFFSQKLGFSDADERLVDMAFSEAESNPGTIEGLSQDILRELNRTEILTLFNGLYDIATIDGNLDKSEIAVITRLAKALNVSDAELRQIRALFVPDAPDSNYSLLGLSADASVAEIKSAFHRAVLENHPDRVAHLGEQAAKMATQRFLEVQKAYEAIRQERGF